MGFRRRVLLVLLAISVLVPLTSAGAGEKSVSIATFNAEFLTRSKVHVKFGFDLRPKKSARFAEWRKKEYRDRMFRQATEAVAEFIATHVPADVLVLTELGDRADVEELQKALLARKVHYPHWEVCECSDNYTKQHVAVLYRYPLSDIQSRIPGREGYYKELDDADSETHTGISKGMIVRFRAAGRMFLLYAVHLASEAGGHEKDAQRLAQASILRRHSLKAIEAGEHVIVAGDMNDRRGEPALRRIRGLDDIGPDLIQTGRSRYFADKDERWTYVHDGNRQQIDHILVSRSLAMSRRSIRTRAGPTPEESVSDHRPLTVTLTFR